MTVQQRLGGVRTGILALTNAASELTAAEISEQTQGLRAEVAGSMELIPPVAENVLLLETLRALAGLLQTLEEQLIEAAVPLMEYTVPALCPLPILAHRLYADAERAAEMLRLNAIADPNRIEAGTVLRVKRS